MAEGGRNYAADMRTLVDEYTTGGEPYNAATLATKITDHLRHTDPDLLSGWLDLQAESMLRTTIARIDASSRGHARTTSARTAFAQAVSAHAATGAEEVFAQWLDTRFTIGEAALRKPLRTMTRGDCQIVASSYEDRARRNNMQAAFLRAIAKKLTGDKTVGEVFNEGRLATLWAELGGNHYDD